jgi:phosphatidate cytidylyltransferase
MFKARVITAVILLACFISLLLLAPPSILFIVFSGIISLAAWEWFRFLWGSNQTLPIILAGILFSILGLTQWFINRDTSGRMLLENTLFIILCLSSIFWVCIVPWIMKQKLHFQLQKYSVTLSVIGFIVFVSDWYALMVLQQKGIGVLLSVFLIVWGADIGAYFFGKLFGKHKLAPNLSPGKSIEGVIGGMLVVCIIGLSCWYFGNGQSNIFDTLATKISVLSIFLITLFLTSMSVVGDLFESQLKRLHGVKDSSQLLPGHGGLMDRIDALMPVLPISALILRGLT